MATDGILLTWVMVVVAGALCGVAVAAVMALPHVGWQYVQRRQAIVSTMQHFGEGFVREFERPLTTPGRDERAVESRLRLIPRRQRLEISIAPVGRHRYPNLSDHRRNVTYDAERIVQLLRDERFVGGQLRPHGKWVIIACQFEFRPEQRGRK
jgi:hypothetical protein